MDESGADTPRIKISPRESQVRMPSRINLAPTGESNRIIENAGLPFWNALSPEMQAGIEGPIRRVEESIARQFPDGYVSPTISRAKSLRDEDGLEKQHDLTSCTYVSTANALRLLDQPRPEYSRSALAAKTHELSGSPQNTIDRREITAILASVQPYNQFTLREQPSPAKVRLNASPEMTEVFRNLAQGDVAVAGWRQSPTRVVGSHGEGFIAHARTITGFSKGADNALQLHIVDPYGARPEVWTFRDWIAAMRMNTLFDNPSYTPEEVKVWMENIDKPNGLMANIANDVIVIHKRQRPPIQIRK
jgi:hypothetical protein